MGGQRSTFYGNSWLCDCPVTTKFEYLATGKVLLLVCPDSEKIVHSYSFLQSDKIFFLHQKCLRFYRYKFFFLWFQVHNLLLINGLQLVITSCRWLRSLWHGTLEHYPSCNALQGDPLDWLVLPLKSGLYIILPHSVEAFLVQPGSDQSRTVSL